MNCDSPASDDLRFPECPISCHISGLLVQLLFLCLVPLPLPVPPWEIPWNPRDLMPPSSPAFMTFFPSFNCHFLRWWLPSLYLCLSCGVRCNAYTTIPLDGNQSIEVCRRNKYVCIGHLNGQLHCKVLYNIYNFPIKEMWRHLQSKGPTSGRIHKQAAAYKVSFSRT